jgi:hypothetical protein
VNDFSKTNYYYVDEDSRGFTISKFFNFLKDAKTAQPATGPKNDIKVSFDVNVYRDARLTDFDCIIAKYFNLFIDTGRVIDIPKK